jgi:hypothetical protein
MRLLAFLPIALTATLNNLTDNNETHKESISRDIVIHENQFNELNSTADRYYRDREFMLQYLQLFQDYKPILKKFETRLAKIFVEIRNFDSLVDAENIYCSNGVLNNVDMWRKDLHHHVNLVNLLYEHSDGAQYNQVSEAKLYLNYVIHKLAFAIKFNKFARMRYNTQYFIAEAKEIKLPFSYFKIANNAFVISYEIECWLEENIAIIVKRIKIVEGLGVELSSMAIADNVADM